MKKTIKMYRHTIQHTEHLPPHLGDEPIISYRQTSWSDCPNFVPGVCSDIVLVEEKEVEIDPEKWNRRKKK